jgi:hypothetical protein
MNDPIPLPDLSGRTDTTRYWDLVGWTEGELSSLRVSIGGIDNCVDPGTSIETIDQSKGEN